MIRSFPTITARAASATRATACFSSAASAGKNKVGFIGLGKMGAGMVQNLADAGHKLVVYDVNPATTASVAESTGAEPATSPADVVSKLGSESAVISMVPNDKALEAVVKGEVSTSRVTGYLCKSATPASAPTLTHWAHTAGRHPRVDDQGQWPASHQLLHRLALHVACAQ